MEIKEAKLRGVKSYGMICGAVEIGLGDLFPTTEEAHILDLSAFDAPAGTPIADALDLHDIILEIDNKSMTNRPDLWGHYGIARELAALYDLPLKPLPPFTCGAGSDGLTVTVEDTERCPRYIGAAVEGLSVKPAPFRMQSRIWRVGMRPINALVDITNYVMLATGQPTHAFDSDNIAGHIIVRRARERRKAGAAQRQGAGPVRRRPGHRRRGGGGGPCRRHGRRQGLRPAHHQQGDSGDRQFPGRRRPPHGPAVRQPHRGLLPL